MNPKINKIIYSAIAFTLTYTILKAVGMYLMWAAGVNVRLRPEILNLTWAEALVSGHFNDWFFAVNEPLMGAFGYVLTSIIMIIALCFIWWVE